MATIKDIARLAGVSHGTVSNVLNKKGNVSMEKILLVEGIAQQLGYNTNAPAQKLRKGQTQSVAVILPNITQESYRQFYLTLSTALGSHEYDISLYLSDSMAHMEQECVERAMSNRPAAIVTFSCLRDVQKAYDQSTSTYFMDAPESLPAAEWKSCSFDYESIAEEIADYCAVHGWKQLAYWGDTEMVRFDRALYPFLEAALKKHAIALTAINCDQRVVGSGAFDVVSNCAVFDAILSGDPLRTKALHTACTVSGTAPLPVVTLSTKHTTPTWDEPSYELDHRQMAMLVVRSILSDEETPLSNQLVMTGAGFRFQAPVVARERKLSLLTLSCPTSSALKNISATIKRLSGIQLQIVDLPYEELHAALLASPNQFDLIRSDVIWLSQLKEQLFMPLTPFADQVSQLVGTFAPSIADSYCTQQGQLYTLPFEPTTQLLFYRKDLFEDAKIRRQFYESKRRQLDVPSNFEEYNEVAAFFTRALNPESPTLYGTTMAYGSALVGSCDFLPRFKALGGSIFDDSGRLCVQTPIMTQAMEHYLYLRQCSDPKINYWWKSAVDSFAGGYSAMTIVFTNHASELIKGNPSVVVGKIASVPVPGRAGMVGGGCIGISKSSKNADLCLELLRLLYSEEISSLLTLLGGLSPCRDVYENEEILHIYPWLRNVTDCFSYSTRFNQSPHYPNFDDNRFEQTIGSALRSAAMGITDVGEALASAQRLLDQDFFYIP